MTRAELLAAVLDRARGGAPLLLAGPSGAGKTWLLRRAAAALSDEGWVPVYLDLMGAASSPERFALSMLEALPAATFGAQLSRATDIRRLAAAGRARGADAVEAVFSLLGDLAQAGGQRVALLLDEATEIRSLCYFEGLRHVDRPFLTALLRRPRGTILATSYPRLARSLWPSLESRDVPPLTSAELDEMLWEWTAAATGEALRRASFGWPRYVRILLETLRPGVALEEAWTREMGAGGRLEQACRHTYEALLLRSRGYGMSKAVLATVAAEEGLNLTALVGRLGRTPGAVRDYLGWLLGVDALRTEQKRYYFVDGLLATWVRLHARGIPATAGEVERAARRLLAEAPGPDAPAASAEAAAPSYPRPDSLMEID
ncbi:MAG TPA: ATP-binding protein [Vicinamibacteria bacterium]